MLATCTCTKCKNISQKDVCTVVGMSNKNNYTYRVCMGEGLPSIAYQLGTVLLSLLWLHYNMSFVAWQLLPIVSSLLSIVMYSGLEFCYPVLPHHEGDDDWAVLLFRGISTVIANTSQILPLVSLPVASGTTCYLL